MLDLVLNFTVAPGISWHANPLNIAPEPMEHFAVLILAMLKYSWFCANLPANADRFSPADFGGVE